MDRDALWSMLVFLEVVERGTLAGAAQALHVTPSAVSKQMTKLEERLGVRLAQRTTRSFRLTAAGTRYREHATRVTSALDDAEADVQRESGALRGRLRVSAPLLLGQQLVAPIVARFLEAHPDIELDLELSDRFVDVVGESIDLAVRVAQHLPESGLTVRTVGTMDWYLVASPAYLARHGTPRVPADLADHTCVELSHAQDRGMWRLETGGKTEAVAVRSRLASTGLVALHHGVREGAGIGRFPEHLVGEDLASGRLVRLLRKVSTSQRVVSLLMPSRSYVPPRVRAFATVLTQELRPALKGGA